MRVGSRTPRAQMISTSFSAHADGKGRRARRRDPEGNGHWAWSLRRRVLRYLFGYPLDRRKGLGMLRDLSTKKTKNLGAQCADGCTGVLPDILHPTKHMGLHTGMRMHFGYLLSSQDCEHDNVMRQCA